MRTATTTDKILLFLTDYPAACKAIRMGIYKKGAEIKKQKDIKDSTLRVILSRLKKKGLVKNKGGLWAMTVKGKIYIRNKQNNLSFIVRNNKSKQKDLVVIFDIPESDRKKRDRLRGILEILGFECLQKSVWIGPAPIPKEFVEYLSQRQILRYIKFFKVEEKNIV